MKKINWEKDPLDDHPVYAADIAKAVDNLANCIEIFLPHEIAKSGSDPLAHLPDALFGLHTVYNAAISVEQYINPMQEQHGCVTGSFRVFTPLWAIRQELWRLYETQGWNDIPVNQFPAHANSAIPSIPLEYSIISGMSRRLRILAQMLDHVVSFPAAKQYPEIKEVHQNVIRIMGEIMEAFRAEPDWKTLQAGYLVTKKLDCRRQDGFAALKILEEQGHYTPK